LPVLGQKRGGAQSKVTNKSKFLSQNRGFSGDTTKSLSVSPALSGVGSPALGPTSKPLSQQQAEQAKSARKPIVHLLALEPMSEKTLQNKIDFHQALSKVADLNSSTSKWELRKNYYKELDVFSFDYESEEDRQRVIDNAVKIFDKMRLGTSEPQWDKLLPKSERGTGKCLSKLQAQIAQGPVAKPKSSNRNSPFDDEEDLFGDKNKNLSKAKGEAMARSSSQPLAAKPKKSEREAQAKRLLSKNPAKAAAAATKPKPAKTTAAAKRETEKAKSNATKPLSSQFVSDSDDEEVELKKEEPVSKPVKKPSNKRLREEEVESSDSSFPLSKKSKVNINNNNNHRVSDASQSSRPSSNSTSSSANSFKGKGNGNGNGNGNSNVNGVSPQKSSPLASSPPTNASDFENTPAGGRSSSSASPPHHTLTSAHNGRSPIHKRHQKSSSVTSSNSSSSSTRYLKAGVIHLAHKYKTFYPKYEALHRELAASGVRDESKEKDLLDMHERLSQLKQQILEGIVEE
jgi:RNA polymerase II elongation factor ELL